MSNYQKFDTSVIRNRIKDGTYPTLAGANRAIGKTQGLSEDDKSGLKKFAAKHFGADAPAAPAAKKAGKKASKKAAAKAPKAAKKANKKAAKKASKRAAKPASDSEAAPAQAKDVAPAPEKGSEVAAAVVAPKRRGRPPGSAKAQKAQPAQQLELPLTEKVVPSGAGAGTSTLAGKATLMGNVIGTCSQMLSSITQANNLIPKEVAAEGSGVVAQVMTRAVRVLDQEVVTPLLNAGDSSTQSAAPAPKVKKTPSRPRNQPAPPVVEAPAEVAAEETTDTEEDDDAEDGLPLDALNDGDDEGDVDLASLSEEERLGVEALRSSAPVNLRTPGANSATR